MRSDQTSSRELVRERPQHLRVTVQIVDTRLNVVSLTVVNETLEPARRVVGPWGYELREAGETVWVDTMPDPMAERGTARPNEYEHPYRRGSAGDFIARVPIARDSLGRPLEIRVFKAKAPVPADMDALQKQVTAREPKELEIVGTVDDAALRRHADWKHVEAALGIVRQEPPARQQSS